MARRKAEARNESEATTKLWAEVQRANHSPQGGTKPTTVTNQLESYKVETAAVATDTDNMSWLKQMIIEVEVNLQSENDDIDIMDARNDNYIESIDRIYDEDGDNKLNEDKMQQAVY